jgi:hypothetical protein
MHQKFCHDETSSNPSWDKCEMQCMKKWVFGVPSNPRYIGISIRHTKRTDDLVSGGVVGMVLTRCAEVAYYACVHVLHLHTS